MFKAMGIRIPQRMDSNPQLKLSQDFTPEDLEKLNKREKHKIKVIKKHFSGKITDHSVEECINQIERALNNIQWSGSYKQEGFKFCCKEDRFGDKLKFEVEVCEVHEDEKTKYGISFRRTAGSVFHYKEVISKLAVAIQL